MFVLKKRRKNVSIYIHNNTTPSYLDTTFMLWKEKTTN